MTPSFDSRAREPRSPSSSRRLAGADAERRAERFLEAEGLQILARNHRCRFGELDLVAADGGTLVFVEVRLRSGDAYGTAAETIGATKRRKLFAAARHYLLTHRYDCPTRFDVVALDGPGGARIRWIRGALSE